MEIFINNKSVSTDAKNLSQLAAELALPDKGVAMAIANNMIPREDWENTSLTEGVNVVIIKAVCGG